MHSLKSGTKTWLLLCITSLISWLVFHFTQSTLTLHIIYILYVLIIARITPNYKYGLLATFLSVLLLGCLIPNSYTSLIESLSNYLPTLVVMLLIVFILNYLHLQVTTQSQSALTNMEYLTLLNTFSSKILLAETTSQLISLGLDYISRFTGASCIFYSKDPLMDDTPYTHLILGQDESSLTMGIEKRLAHECYATRNVTKSPTPPGCAYLSTYLPVIAHSQRLGVIGICCKHPAYFNDQEKLLIRLVCDQLSLALLASYRTSK